MQDIQVKIFRPISMPKQFAGAPEGPAFVSIGICTILFTVASLADLPFPVFFMLLLIVIHVALIGLYNREPHLSTLMATFHSTIRKVRALGPTYEAEYHP